MKTKKRLMFVPLMGLMFLFSCGVGGGDNMEYAELADGVYEEPMNNADYVAEDQLDETGKLQETESTENYISNRKLIKNASLSFETDSLEVRKKIIDKAVKDYSGYISHEEQYAYYDRENIMVTARVPANSFDAFLAEATAGIGTFESKTISVNDVTEEYVDVEARVKTKKELKQRLIELLDKAVTIDEILEIEREIAALQGEIESVEGRLKVLSSGVKYSTVTITYYKTIPVPVKFDNKFENAFETGWLGLVWFFVGLVSIWPFLLIALTIILIVRYRIKKRKLNTRKS